jgi:predicted RNA binding protein with dsRBD fold (UPF0201 family)
MSKVKNMIALQALIEEKRRTGFASDIAAANEADAVLDTIHKEIIRLEAIEAAARRVLTDGHTEAPYYMDLRDHDETLADLAAAIKTADPEPSNAFEWLRTQGRRSPKWKGTRKP